MMVVEFAFKCLLVGSKVIILDFLKVLFASLIFLVSAIMLTSRNLVFSLISIPEPFQFTLYLDLHLVVIPDIAWLEAKGRDVGLDNIKALDYQVINCSLCSGHKTDGDRRRSCAS